MITVAEAAAEDIELIAARARPADVAEVRDALASLLDVPPEVVEDRTTATARALFAWT